MNATQAPDRFTQPQSSWVDVGERAIIVSALCATVAAVLWQIGLGATAIVVLCVIGASIAGWTQPAPQRQLTLQRVSVVRRRRTVVR